MEEFFFSLENNNEIVKMAFPRERQLSKGKRQCKSSKTEGMRFYDTKLDVIVGAVEDTFAFFKRTRTEREIGCDYTINIDFLST